MEPPAAAAPAPAPDFAAVLQRLGIDQQSADEQREWIKNPANKQAMDALVPAKAERALLLTLDPGAYSAQVTGTAGTTGISLLEIYEVP